MSASIPTQFDGNTVIESLHLARAELRICRIANTDRLLEAVDDESFSIDEQLPYWAEIWPSAVALAEYLLNQDDLNGLEVLELGCGLGIAGLVAAKRGAHVTLTDIDTDALAFARYNAQLNNLSPIHTEPFDWRSTTKIGTFDRILAADVIYETRWLDPVATVIKRLLKPNGKAIIAEPGRSVANQFTERFDPSDVHTDIHMTHWNGHAHRIHIHHIQPV